MFGPKQLFDHIGKKKPFFRFNLIFAPLSFRNIYTPFELKINIEARDDEDIVKLENVLEG